MTSDGPRCDEHVGNPFPSRCRVCESLEAEWNALTAARRHEVETEELTR